MTDYLEHWPDLYIVVLLTVWFFMDRFHVYLRKEPGDK